MTLTACSGGDEEYYDEAEYYAGSDFSGGGEFDSDEEVEAPEFDESAARLMAEDEVASETYGGIGAPYGCTIDCSGHEAGFEWRRDNGYVTAGNSRSFAQGAQAFEDAVTERVEEMRMNHEEGLETFY